MGSHFVEDYERLVSALVAARPLDEAMSMVVGGLYNEIGKIELDILRHSGLRNQMFLIDLGCGSGRLSTALSNSDLDVGYLGIDIVQALLDYARSKANPRYDFRLHRELSIPAADGCADMICAFSLFTHLNHHETYLYIQDAHRALKQQGKLVFSFLEFGESAHWSVFEATVVGRRRNELPHLNAFIERPVINLWAQKLGFAVVEFIDAAQAVNDLNSLGQSTAVLAKA